MKDIDIRTVDPATLVDAKSVRVRQELPRIERMRDYMRQIGNPYCFRVGKVVVKLSFASGGETLTDRLESLMARLC
jgi:hypothetical protein